MNTHKVKATMTISVETEFTNDGKTSLTDQAHSALEYDFAQGNDEEFNNYEIEELN